MMTRTVPVTADWSVWEVDRSSEQPRLLARSYGPADADDFADLLALCPLGAPEVAISGLAGQAHDYLGVVLHDVPASRDPSHDPEGEANDITVTHCFRVPYWQMAAGPVSYQALHAGLRAVRPPLGDGKPAELLLNSMSPDGPDETGQPPESTDDFRMRVAALLLTAHPVCILGADGTAVDDRLRFLDDVTALLPYGMRSQLAVTTWAGDRPHGFRLYFGSAVGSSDAHVVNWDMSALPSVTDQYASDYFGWLRAATRPTAVLAARTAQLGFSQVDIQALLADLGIAIDGQSRHPPPLGRDAYRTRRPSAGRVARSAAFMSYAHFDDKHEGGQLSAFREQLSGAVQFHTGQKFTIFQDRTGILWGENWRERIEDALDGATLLLPMITPSFFASQYCRDEVTRFMTREQRLGRSNLIFPVYYADCPQMDDSEAPLDDDIAALLRSRQYADWRDLRLEDFTSNRVRVAVDDLAQRIRDALRTPDEREPGADHAANITTHATAPGRTATRSRALSAPSPRPEPLVFVVDQYGQGDFSSIGAAIRAARPGDVIRVRPGLYEESLRVDKPLEIVGEGSRDRVIVQAGGRDVLVFTAAAGRVSRLTLRQIGGGARWNSVFIQRGRLELEDCDISCQSLSGIDIGDGADPLITANIIHDCRQAGILIHDAGRGTMRDNDIYGNAHAGVEIMMYGNPTLTRNRIRNCAHAGVFVHHSGQGMIEENEIYAMPAYGVTIRSRGNPTLLENAIHDCALNGVFIYEQGEGLLKGNKIYATGYSGVAIRESANPVLSGNLIHDTKEAGILVSNGGLGTIEDNDIFSNAMAGVRIRTDANPTLRRNRIFDNRGLPINNAQGGKGTFEDNELNGEIPDATTRTAAPRRRVPLWTLYRGRRGAAS